MMMAIHDSRRLVAVSLPARGYRAVPRRGGLPVSRDRVVGVRGHRAMPAGSLATYRATYIDWKHAVARPVSAARCRQP